MPARFLIPERQTAMHLPQPLHDWHISPAEAVALQRTLAARVIHDAPLDLTRIQTVAGVDVSVRPHPQTGAAISYGAVVVLSFPDLRVIETRRAAAPTPFPYISGLLSFREAPVLLEAFAALHHTPDVLIFDGMGRAHPRRLGIAAHLGVWLDLPAIGCGKTHLLGTSDPLPDEAGSVSPLIDRGEVIGAVVRTRARVSPVYISVGHRADLDSAVTFILRCTTRYRLPEPIRAAHHAAGQPYPD